MQVSFGSIGVGNPHVQANRGGGLVSCDDGKKKRNADQSKKKTGALIILCQRRARSTNPSAEQNRWKAFPPGAGGILLLKLELDSRGKSDHKPLWTGLLVLEVNPIFTRAITVVGIMRVLPSKKVGGR